VTLPIGLGIGRIVFRALNVCEVVLAAIVVAASAVHGPGAAVAVASGAAIGSLFVQLVAVRPLLSRRTRAVLAGEVSVEHAPRSRAHLVYIALEAVKVVALVVTGVLLLST
jgi:hypothetical protein